MPTNHSTTWVVVADKCQAKIFRLVKFPKIKEIDYLEHPESGARNQDLISTKPGRNFQSGGVTRHAYQQETDPKQLEAMKFATEVAKYLSLAKQKEEFSRLYIFAEPSFLGLLRQHLTPEIQKTIVSESTKCLTSCDTESIEKHLLEV
ncbi:MULTISPECIES: host attachment protein [Parachlamydia]|jgi:protein required for attachment to host cells|uniref:Host attachment protein n=2 Tax=Parachlamydia acanthamoebae TaxID=83552 RepID=F8L1D1_PARAV|nr:host attachment protein [Parachlamydia acanthamoebae]EFB40688.1 hypothetical protein pah_c197o078 [Parachlamydia acanthamoebae str. Hall's coccus]CCB87067.1 putative uncharacterized protein [Parachlamydia acanthamoebae UV-7]